MTSWLSDWLRDIVLIILLATFVDLLIPNNSLQRYVKVVVSLIIMLTILSPVISFLKGDLALKFAAEQTSGTGDQSIRLSNILEDGAKLKYESERRSSRLVQEEMEKMIKHDLEQAFPLSVHEVQVTIREEEGKQPVIQMIKAVLDVSGEVSGDKSIPVFEDDSNQIPGQESGIDPVNPVAVKIQIEPLTTGKDAGMDTQTTITPTQLALQQQVVRHIREWWGVAENNVRVDWE